MLKLIESAYMALTVLDSEGNVVGFAAFSEEPRGILGEGLESWLSHTRVKYGEERFNVSNTVFLSFFAAQKLFETDVMEHVLRTTFTTLPAIDYAVFLLPLSDRVSSTLSTSAM